MSPTIRQDLGKVPCLCGQTFDVEAMSDFFDPNGDIHWTCPDCDMPHMITPQRVHFWGWVPPAQVVETRWDERADIALWVALLTFFSCCVAIGFVGLITARYPFVRGGAGGMMIAGGLGLILVGRDR